MAILSTKFKIVILTLLLGVFVSACGGSTGEVAPTTAVNTDAKITLDGKTLLEERCTACHTLDRVESASKSAGGWGLNVREMVGKGAELNASEQEVLIEYLSITYRYP
jgi:cytochrome c5